MQATFPVYPAVEGTDDMVKQQPQEQSWKTLLNQWAQIIVILSGMAASVGVIEHRLTTLEMTSKQAGEKGAALSSLAVESVIKWIEIQRDAAPVKSPLRKQADDFIKEIKEKQNKIGKVQQGDVAGSDRNN